MESTENIKQPNHNQELLETIDLEEESNQESYLNLEPYLNQQSLKNLASINVDQNNIQIDLENWMGNLPEHLNYVPVIYLAIPGSHNSFSYSISPHSDISPDSPPLVQSLGKWCRPIINRIIYKWSQGQKEDAAHQLSLGIRYFDVRLVTGYDGEIVISHGLYGDLIEKFLLEINDFLTTHKKEIVILDFQNFYEFERKQHDKMVSMLLQIFGTKICRRQRKLKENTLHILRQLQNQVLIIYRHQVTRYYDIFWPSGVWATPWPNKIKVSELLESLNNGLSTRKTEFGFVSQGILTPTPKYVAAHAFGSLKKLSSKANKEVISWLESKSNGVHGLNVVLCDFIERYQFCEKVVRLNYKSFEDYQKHFNITIPDENLLGHNRIY